MFEMLPHYVTHCHSQDLGFKGPNLAEKRREKIRLQAAGNEHQVHPQPRQWRSLLRGIGNRLHTEVPGRPGQQVL